MPDLTQPLPSRPETTAPTLSDGVVTIRAHRAEDALRAHEQSTDPVSQAWTTVPLSYSMEDAHRFVGEVMPGGWLTDEEWGFAIEVDGDYAGTISLRNQGQGRAEIAYGSHPTIRGTGAMERALRLLLGWGFAERDLDTVVWWANRGNWASRKVAWRLGFTIEGSLRHWLPQRGELLDAWVGTLLRDDPREPRTDWLDVPLLDDGAGLVLRAFRDTDVDRVVEACSDPETQRWLGTMPSPYTAEHAHAWFEQCTEKRATGAALTWCLAESVDGPALGAINVFDIRPGADGEVGYWMHPDARGRGLMQRAVRLVTGYSFEVLGLRRVRAGAAVDNLASRRVIEAAGFSPCGVEREGTIVRSGRADLATYDVLAAE